MRRSRPWVLARTHTVAAATDLPNLLSSWLTLYGYQRKTVAARCGDIISISFLLEFEPTARATMARAVFGPLYVLLVRQRSTPVSIVCPISVSFTHAGAPAGT